MAHLLLSLFLVYGGGFNVEWSEATVHFYGPVDLAVDTTYRSQLESSLDSLLATIPFDSEHSFADIVEGSRSADLYFKTAITYPQVISTRYSTSGEVQNEYAISLLGPFIEEFVSHSGNGSMMLQMRGGSPDSMSETGLSVPAIPSTGFVIDARGIGFSPCVFPRILDQSGNVIFQASMVDKEVIRDKGFVHYAYSPREALQTRELGLNPLRIVAEQSMGNNGCDLVLSAADADQITSSMLNLKLLSEGRVIIIIDRN